MSEGAARAIKPKMTFGRWGNERCRGLSELTRAFVFMAISQKQRGRVCFHYSPSAGKGKAPSGVLKPRLNSTHLRAGFICSVTR